jgi:hypothetical protein
MRVAEQISSNEMPRISRSRRKCSPNPALFMNLIHSVDLVVQEPAKMIAGSPEINIGGGLWGVNPRKHVQCSHIAFKSRLHVFNNDAKKVPWPFRESFRAQECFEKRA